MGVVSRAKKAAKKSGRKLIPVAGKIAAVAWPVAGAAVAGPAGAAAGTAAASAFGRYSGAVGARAKGRQGVEARRAGRKQAVRSAKIGLAITGVAGGLAAAGGGGVAESSVSVLGRVFGGGAAAPVPQSALDAAYESGTYGPQLPPEGHPWYAASLQPTTSGGNSRGTESPNRPSGVENILSGALGYISGGQARDPSQSGSPQAAGANENLVPGAEDEGEGAAVPILQNPLVLVGLAVVAFMVLGRRKS